MIHIVKAVVFPAVTYSCESWTIKKAEHQRTDAFKPSCWRRLRVLWTAGRSNQSTLREINPEYSLKGLTLKLRLQYFGHLIQMANSLEKSLVLGKIEGRGEEGIRGWDGSMVSSMQWTQRCANFGWWWREGRHGMLQSMGSQRVRHDWVTEQQQFKTLYLKQHVPQLLIYLANVLIVLI